MPTPDRPVSGASIESAWGQGVHDRVFAAKGALCSGNATSINDASDQTLPIDTALDDPGGWVDTANNRLVVPTGGEGIYLLLADFSATTGAVGSETRGSIYVNGSKVTAAVEQNEAGGTIRWTAITIEDLVAGDIITATARLLHDAGANPSVALTHFNVLFMTDVRGA